jgi:hypothetical protein
MGDYLIGKNFAPGAGQDGEICRVSVIHVWLDDAGSAPFFQAGAFRPVFSACPANQHIALTV